MIRRSTWIVLALFAAVIVFAWYFQANISPKLAEPTPTTMVSNLWTLDENIIANVTLENTEGKRLVLGRDASGVWTVVDPQGEAADTAAIESAISQLVSMRVTTSLEPAADMVVFGLSEPAATIDVVLNGGEKHTLRVGDITPTGSGYYVQVDSNPPQVLSKYSLEVILRMLDSPPFLPTATPDLTLSPEASPEVNSTPPAETSAPGGEVTATATP